MRTPKALSLSPSLVLLALTAVAAAQAVLTTPAAPIDDSPDVVVEPTQVASQNKSAVSFRRDGLWFSTRDGATHLQVHGYAQADDRMFLDTIHGGALDTFLFRRLRPLFEGALFNAVDFRFMPDFGQSTYQVQEAFLELKTLKYAKLRAGKFKEPIGLEVLRSDRDLTFAERSLASDLVPLRYIGAQLAGSILGDSISYAGGYFDGSSDGSNGAFSQWSHGNEAAARIFLRPFASAGPFSLHQFGIGVGGSTGSQHGTIAGLKTMGQTTFFKYSSGAVANGQHNRLMPQAYYYIGPFGLLGEYAISSQQVLNKSFSQRVRNEAWQIAGSFMLTGEKNAYAGVRPRNATEHAIGFRRLGALELKLRCSQLRIDRDAFPQLANPATAAESAKEKAVGLSWYLNRYVKLESDYEHTGFGMASSTARPLRSENVLMNRVQLAF
ncbi:MAG TPA: porin [Candidatus Sulfotelmatobacter sp.]|nr:porin [Candidatus Sulfotelmatobacter sp.]